MDSIRSNLNGIANAHRFDRLRTLRHRITTCFHNWQARTLEKTSQHNQRQSNQGRYQQQQQQQQKQKPEHLNEDYFEFRRECKANSSLRSLNRKLRKLINKRYTNCSNNSNDSINNNNNNNKNKNNTARAEQQQKQHTVEFLSSTLIGDDTLDNIGNSIARATDALQQDQNMPLNENNTNHVVPLSDDYPDLAAEVRGILLARAQNGATISDIKEDYYKNTGRNFPVVTHITEFLLSIPQISAICMENGTRIFCVIPTEKTEHLYNLIMQQRQPRIQQSLAPPLHYYQPPHQRQQSRYYGTEHQHHQQQQQQQQHNRQYQHRPMQMPNYPRHSLGSSTYSYQRSAASSNSNDCNCKTETEAICNGIERADDQNLMAPIQTDSYQDNCNHLYSRLYYQQQLNYPNNTEMQFISRNHNRNRNNFNHNHNMSNSNNYIDCADSNNGNFVFNDNNEQMQQHMPHQIQQQSSVQEQSEEQYIRHEIKIPSRNFMNNRNSYMTRTRLSSPTYTRSSQGYASQSDSLDSENEAHLYDFSLLGDDFFLYMARMELRCKFKKNQRVLQSGLCVSGQTITAAIKRIQEMIDCNKSIIINVGSVDIMQGKSLIQIEHDLRELLKVMRSRGHTPILTTLAPLANYSHDKKIKENLLRFNEYIKRQKNQVQVIDIWSCLVSDKQQTLFDCYQNEPRIVSGATEPYVFWNKIGRQRVLKLIESAIEY